MRTRDWLLSALVCLLPGLTHAASCTVTATSVAFGVYASPGGVQTDSSGTVTVTCTPDFILLACKTPYTVSLSQGGAASYAPRKLASGANTLNYNLYTNAARSTVWGDGSGGSSTVVGTVSTSILSLLCLSGSNNHTVYSRIPAAQSVAAGAYADTITVTVTY
jgi:spore coat protein U-like protein